MVILFQKHVQYHHFQKGFIRAETISFNDFIEYKGEKGSKDAGKLRTEGKDYIVKDGAVISQHIGAASKAQIEEFINQNI